jgi:hypothetical protein
VGFLIIFVIAVVIIGSIVITLNIRAIRLEAEAELRRRSGVTAQSGGHADSAPPAARGAEHQPVLQAELDQRKRPFTGATAGSPPAPSASARRADDDRLSGVATISEMYERQMSDDEYRAAIRAMATGQPLETAQTRTEAAAGESNDAAYRAGLRSLSGLDTQKEP